MLTKQLLSLVLASAGLTSCAPSTDRGATTASSARAIDSAPRTVFWADWQAKVIHKVRLADGLQDTVLYPASAARPGLAPMTLTRDGERLWWTSHVPPGIFASDLDGKNLTQVVGGESFVGYPQYVVVDAAHGRIFFTSNNNGEHLPIDTTGVWSADLQGNDLHLLLGRKDFPFIDAKGIALDSRRDTLYMSSPGEIFAVKLTPDHLGVRKQESGPLFSNQIFVAGIAYDEGRDRIFWASPAGGYIKSATPTAARPTVLYTFPDRDDSLENPDPGPIGITYDAARDELYWVRQVHCNCVQRGSADGGNHPETLVTAATPRIFGVAIMPK
jgi:sugar lactone lactonase YvrE